MMRRQRPVAALLACAFALAGCSRYEPLSLHGAGSMRVEVEVYKGPLTKPAVAQIGELAGVLTESIYALDGWESQAERMLSVMHCGPYVSDRSDPSDRRDCAALTSALYSAGDALGFACYFIRSDEVKGVFDRSVWLPMGTCNRRDARIAALESIWSRSTETDRRQRPGRETPNLAGCPKPANARCLNDVFVLAINNLATLMRGSAFRAADGNVRFVPRRREVRSLLTSFGYIASEFGNQLQARVNVLQRQFGAGGSEAREARLLPMTEYLRDSGNTDFVQLFDWLNATADGGVGGFPRGRLDPQERIRMAQRLTSDYYWQKVNEVYTSGQGDVSMAFIKDDLGNWDLKSFSNDPSELLRSYRRVTNAALKTASRLATANNLSAAQQAAGLANQLATGEVDTPAPAGELGLPALRDRVSARLAAERARYSTRMTELENKIGLENSKIDAAKDLKASLAAQVGAGDAAAIAKSKEQDDIIQAANLEKLVLERRKADLPRDAMAAVNQILDDHLATVAALQQSVSGSPAPTPAP